MNITYAFSFHFLLRSFLYYTLIQSVTTQKRTHTVYMYTFLYLSTKVLNEYDCRIITIDSCYRSIPTEIMRAGNQTKFSLCRLLPFQPLSWLRLCQVTAGC